MNQPQNISNILIADNHPLYRECLQELIKEELSPEKIKIAHDAKSLLIAIDQGYYEMLIIDIAIADGGFIELIKQIKAKQPEIKILVCTSINSAEVVQRVIKAGALGYILKKESIRQLILAIHAVTNGTPFVCSEIDEEFNNTDELSIPDFEKKVKTFTDREFEIFQLIGTGKGTNEIADELNVSHKTVETHRLNIKKKLNVQRNLDMIRLSFLWVLNKK